MVETAKRDMVTDRKDGAWEMDVAAYCPDPTGYIKVGGEEFPIYSFLDIVIEDSIRVSTLGDDIRELDDYDQRMARSIEQIMLLNKPAEKRLTREHFASMVPRQVIMLTVLASSIAGIPQVAVAEPGSDSRSSSPAPAASTESPSASSSESTLSAS